MHDVLNDNHDSQKVDIMCAKRCLFEACHFVLPGVRQAVLSSVCEKLQECTAMHSLESACVKSKITGFIGVYVSLKSCRVFSNARSWVLSLAMQSHGFLSSI